jgi:1-deoxy-D-xylulose-5-phosphate reductoisomerase
MKKKVNIFGSTGSIGTSSLNVIEENQELFSVEMIAAGSNIELLKKQINQFSPVFASIQNQEMEPLLKDFLKSSSCSTSFIPFSETPYVDNDITISAIVGSAGLEPTFRSLSHTRRLALANKESMVTAGDLINSTCKEQDVEIIPVDSEHNAIHQCLKAGRYDEVHNLILTASGGPFFGKSTSDLEFVTVEDALNHPTWSMGSKITVDSATLMNKGLEVIEAHYLFDMPYDNIQVKVHPQSIIHSMVEYIDGSIISQMGVTDMKLPIHYALFFPKRMHAPSYMFDTKGSFELSFHEPDMDTFKCLPLAYQCGKGSLTSRIVLNGANEVAVNGFLNGKISFNRVPEFIENMLDRIDNKDPETIEEILALSDEVMAKAIAEVNSGTF